jgi:Icc-related predicted phosphoesterase
MLPRGEHMKINWQFIPMDTDVLVSHGPPKLCGLGVCQDGTEAGDEDLFDRIMIVKPQLVVCGHIHEGYGEVDIIHGESKEESRTVVVNASMMDAQYRYVNKPIYKTVKQK